MSRIKSSMLAALASAALTFGCLSLVQRGRANEAARLRDENNRMRFQASQRKPATAPAIATTTGQNAADPAHRAATLRPAATSGDYRNDGQATPIATLQTFAWACDRGDVEAVGRIISFDDVARDKAAAFLASLPENMRPPGRTLNEMAAALLTSDAINNPFPAVAILERAAVTQISDERIALLLPGTARERTEFQKADGVWRYVITEAMVDDYVTRSAQAAAAR